MLNGPLGGSLFNRKLFTRTQIWTSTLTSQATKRRRNLSPRTILKNLVLLLWPIPHLRRPFLLLMLEFLCSSLFFLCFYIRFLFVGPGARDIYSPSDKYSFFFIVCVLIVVSLLFSLIYMARVEDQSETNKLVKLSRCGLVD